MNKKQIKSIGIGVLLITIFSSNVLAFADTKECGCLKETNKENYEKVEGEIISIEKLEHTVRLEIKGESVFHMNISEDTQIYKRSSFESVDIESIKEGDNVYGYYDIYKPMILIYPPQYAVDTLIIMDEDFLVKEGVLKDGKLIRENEEIIMNLNEAKIFDIKGEEKSIKDAQGQRVLSSHKIETKSLPAIASPDVLIILSSEKDVMYELPKGLKNESIIINDEFYIKAKEASKHLGYFFSEDEEFIRFYKFGKIVEVKKEDISKINYESYVSCKTIKELLT